MVAAYAARIAKGWIFNEFSTQDESTVKKQIVEIMILCPIGHFQPGAAAQ